MKTEKTNEKASDNLIFAAFQKIVDTTEDIVFVKDIHLAYVAVSEPFVKMVEKKNAGEIIGRIDTEIFADESLAKRYMADDRKLLSGGRDLVDYIEPLADFDGQARYGCTSKYILFDADGCTIGILGVIQDITRDYMARQHYQQELKYLFELPKDTYAVSYIDIEDWRIISQRRQTIEGRTLQACYTVESLCEAALESIAEEESDAAVFYRNFTSVYLKEIYESGRTSFSFKYRRQVSDDAVRWVYNEVRFLTDADSGHLCVMLSAKDIDAEKKEQLELRRAARMDKMTMLFNRETTMTYIKQILEEEADGKHVLFMFDVDNFKHLNDTKGHQCGDEFLIALASEIKKTFTEDDVVGRIGGDEFFAFMKNVSCISQAEQRAQELLETIQTLCAKYHDPYLSGSIGISVYPENGKNIDELYGQADSALYQAKRKGKNQYIFAPL